MSNQQIQVRIFPDGRIKAEVIGVKGKSCVDYIAILEQLLDAEATESAYTDEYYETEQQLAVDDHSRHTLTNGQGGS
jgi:hypothetical protein